jgi:hypothetical protein
MARSRLRATMCRLVRNRTPTERDRYHAADAMPVGAGLTFLLDFDIVLHGDV